MLKVEHAVLEAVYELPLRHGQRFTQLLADRSRVELQGSLSFGVQLLSRPRPDQVGDKLLRRRRVRLHVVAPRLSSPVLQAENLLRVRPQK
eukprot:3913312-Prymnesium_polylepis.1